MRIAHAKARNYKRKNLNQHKEKRMQDNVQKEEGGISLLEILRLLLNKIKILFLVVIAAGIVGGTFGLWNSWNDLYFGTQVEFYVNPEKPRNNGSEGTSQYGVYGAYGRHVMDNMIKLLESESFTEQLLLDGNALPTLTIEGKAENEKGYPVITPFGNVLAKGQKWSWVSPEKPEYAKLAAALKTANEAREHANDSEHVDPYNAALVEKNEQTKVYNNLSNELDKEWLSLSLTMSDVITDSAFNEENYKEIVANTALVGSGKVDRLIALYNKKADAKSRIDAAQVTINEYENVTLKAANDAEKAALELWRATPGYKSALNSYASTVRYSYLEADVDMADANNLARSFIYVRVSVVGEQYQDFAREVLRRVKDIVPSYVEENMTVPADYEGTNCQRITRTDEIARTNPLHRSKQAIKYSLFAAAAALVVACVIIVIIDKSDKRLRDTEIITKKFNVPVLGIVPSIEELNEETLAKKASKISNKEAK